MTRTFAIERRRSQRGATLLVVLVMLVVITLLGIAGIRLSGTSLLVVGNMQSRKFVENHGLQAIEQVISSINAFNNPTAAVAVAAPAGVTVTVSPRTCVFSGPAAGYSLLAEIVPDDNIWEFSVEVNDSFTSAKTKMVQGAKIRQIAGSCT